MRLRPLCLLALLPLLAAAPAPQPGPHPALWKLADKDTTIYLFGTIHVLPPELQWRDAKIDAALGQAQSLTLETVLDKDPEALGTLLLSMGAGKDEPPLDHRIPEGKRAALATLVNASGFPPAMLDKMKTWAAAIVLTGAAIQQIGLQGNSGVEAQLTSVFRTAGKPVDGLETPAQQLGFFDRLPEASQRVFLENTLDSPEQARKDFDAMIASWSSGDAKAIEESFAKDPEFTPALADLLIRQRDRAWAEALATRLKRPGVSFVAVGAGHLVGPDSVQKMLAAKGLKVERVQ